MSGPARGRVPEPGRGASVLVAALSSAFGVVLLSATGFIDALVRADPVLGDSATVTVVLSIMAVILVGLAVYVGAVVTANTFATIVAGRTRQIAMLRLIGASARSQRAAVAREGLWVGAVGAACGLVAGTALSALGVAAFEAQPAIADVGYGVARPVLLVPAAVVVLTTWLAAWVGARPVLSVAPLEALGAAVPRPHGDRVRRPVRTAAAVALFAVGGMLLAAGILLGLVSPLGVVVAFFGGILSFTGLVLGAALVMPPVLRAVGYLFGTSVPARLAAQNALRYPERSSRTAIGVVIGVTLVTMFAVALETVKAVLTAAADGEDVPGLDAAIDTFSVVMMGLIGVSALIAAVGVVNLLTLGVSQRRRELGLLRALGLSTPQVRLVVLLEAAHVTVAAVLTGLVLGIAYGWAGAQSLLGSVPTVSGHAAFVWPAVPAVPIAVIVLAAALLTLVAASAPSRLATRISPVAALAEG